MRFAAGGSPVAVKHRSMNRPAEIRILHLYTCIRRSSSRWASKVQHDDPFTRQWLSKSAIKITLFWVVMLYTETLVYIYQSTWYHMPEHCDLHINHREKPKPHKIWNDGEVQINRMCHAVLRYPLIDDTDIVELVTGVWARWMLSKPSHLNFFQIHSNILTSTPKYMAWSLSSIFLLKFCVHFRPVPWISILLSR
jgi:hypothetical protein